MEEARARSGRQSGSRWQKEREANEENCVGRYQRITFGTGEKKTPSAADGKGGSLGQDNGGQLNLTPSLKEPKFGPRNLASGEERIPDDIGGETKP